MSESRMGDLTDNEYDPTALYKARLINLANRADAQFNVTEKIEAGRQYAMDHPIITIAGVTTMLMCSMPVMLFVAFIIGTLVCTFMGFLFIEGFLLTIGGILLGTALLATGIVSLFITVVLALAWLFFHYGTRIMMRTSDIVSASVGGFPPEYDDSGGISSTYKSQENGSAVHGDNTEKQDREKSDLIE